MVRKYITASLCAAAALVCSCNKEENPSDTLAGHTVTLNAAAAGSEETKAIFDAKGYFYWMPGDAIGIATSGAGSFAKLELTDGKYTTSGSFSGQITGSIGSYAVYPYNENHKIDGDKLTYHLPDTYTYSDLDHDFFAAGAASYCNSANAPAYGVINVDDDGVAHTSFSHLCGVLGIKVYGLKSNSGYITLTADRQITGDFTVDLSKKEPTLSTSSKADDSSTERTVTINYSSKTYDGTSGVDGVFYIPMPAGNYYLTIEVGYEDGNGKTMRITKANTHTETIYRKDMLKRKLSYSTMAKDSYVIYHGHKFVDLGLSVFWAETNIGATDGKEFGDYYLYSECSTALRTWGNSCRLPSVDEAKNLYTNCTLDTGTIYGDNADNYYLKITSKTNTNSIILPAAKCKTPDGTMKTSREGHYWTSDSSQYLYFYIHDMAKLDSESPCILSTGTGYYYTVRPVMKVY